MESKIKELTQKIIEIQAQNRVLKSENDDLIKKNQYLKNELNWYRSENV